MNPERHRHGPLVPAGPNGIPVRMALERPDAEIKAEVEEILAWDGPDYYAP